MSILDKLHDQAMEAAFLADLERRKGNEEDAAKLSMEGGRNMWKCRKG